MTKKETSWLRIALIRWFVYDNVPLVGDLIEESAHRSRSWFWRQLIFAVLARFTTVARAALRDPFKRSASNAAGQTSIGTLKQPPIQLTSSRRGVRGD